MKGNLDDVAQELVVPCYTRATTQLLVFVVLWDEHKEMVTFSDVELLIDPK